MGDARRGCGRGTSNFGVQEWKERRRKLLPPHGNVVACFPAQGELRHGKRADVERVGIAGGGLIASVAWWRDAANAMTNRPLGWKGSRNWIWAAVQWQQESDGGARSASVSKGKRCGAGKMFRVFDVKGQARRQHQSRQVVRCNCALLLVTFCKIYCCNFNWPVGWFGDRLPAETSCCLCLRSPLFFLCTFLGLFTGFSRNPTSSTGTWGPACENNCTAPAPSNMPSALSYSSSLLLCPLTTWVLIESCYTHRPSTMQCTFVVAGWNCTCQGFRRKLLFPRIKGSGHLAPLANRASMPLQCILLPRHSLPILGLVLHHSTSQKVIRRDFFGTQRELYCQSYSTSN